MQFKLNREYSNKTIQKHCKNIVTSGQFIGGEHTIQSDNLKFVMLKDGAWRGTNSIYYKCVQL